VDLPELPSHEGQEKRLLGIPSLSRFVGAAESLLERADASRFRECEPLLLDMLRSGFP